MIDYAFDEKLLNRIRANLNRFSKRKQANNGLKEAAVAITIVENQQEPSIPGIPFSEPWTGHAAMILTRRASNLRNHAGQWALPGGHMEDGESPEAAVLRELEEEVGLTLGHNRVIGRLDDYSTRSGFIIKPMVVWGDTDLELTANPDEVASIHRIPLAELLRDDAPMFQEIPESEHPVLFMPIGNSMVAAPTAAIMYQFREVALLGNDVRVAHYEQPYFAWQ
ncbi:CoA pyrophosphatase [Desulfosarcina sp.]|uniref:NUDIX hydrolase n=1 Tax=Desulfosarcina sp. TaxID=2027861 RepID=UPI0035658B6F